MSDEGGQAKAPEPWEMQTDEPMGAFDAFRTYRDLGPLRTARAVAETMGKSKPYIAELSAKYGWVERARAWDAEQDRIVREENERALREQAREMNVQQAALGRTLREIARQRAESFRKRLDDEPDASVEMTWTEVARLAESGSKIERLAMGEVTERAEYRVAREVVGAMIGVAIRYVPAAQRRAFLTELEVSAGLGSLVGGGDGDDE